MRRPTTDNSNRIRELVDSMSGLGKPSDKMKAIQQILPASPKRSVYSGGIFTFVYNAKTPGIIFDPFPLVGVERVFEWGFIGINVHWGKTPEDMRNYSWNEIIGNVYEVQGEELEDMERLSYGDFEQSPSK